MLQSLLQPTRYSSPPKMIGAMPAVAVRHERRREKRRRPSQLALQLGRSGNSPSPTPSPPGHRYHSELYVCGKVAVLHAVVGSLLLGIVVMVVGLVQLSPGAEAAQHRYYLMGAGAALMGVGLVAAVLRCLCIHWYNRKMHPVLPEVHAQGTPHAPHAPPAAPTHHNNGVEADKQARHVLVERSTPAPPPLRSQASVTSPRQDPALDLLVKQPAT